MRLLNWHQKATVTSVLKKNVFLKAMLVSSLTGKGLGIGRMWVGHNPTSPQRGGGVEGEWQLKSTLSHLTSDKNQGLKLRTFV